MSYRAELREGDELFEIIDDTADYFRQVLARNGYYITGPVVFRSLPESREFTIMTSLGNTVNLVGSRDTGFDFHERVELDTKYFYRHFDIDEPVPYAEIEKAVRDAGANVKSIYHVILDFYGETVLDLYVEAETP
ncbi:hypothetical protein [Leifsonia aquatica]|uniref:hypothetical protein n=1 Tax=Leifsonia aquatica TaxID=144185 RepID=UPI00380771AE